MKNIRKSWSPAADAIKTAQEVRIAINHRWETLSPGQVELIEKWMDLVYVDSVNGKEFPVSDYL